MHVILSKYDVKSKPILEIVNSLYKHINFILSSYCMPHDHLQALTLSKITLKKY